jgi:hypothetical protein
MQRSVSTLCMCLLTAMSIGCGSSSSGPAPDVFVSPDTNVPTTCEDLDNDGHFAKTPACTTGDDCNDSNASIFAGAPEPCGTDNNCDGLIDACCQDKDQDGAFGKTSDCLAGADCDDNNAAKNPSASEICGDDVDQNCDGVDEQCNVCEPQCEGKQCGDDSCGGTCGTCGDGALCNDATGICEFETLPGSCAGRCGVFDATANCQCDNFCVMEGDCCDDLCIECEVEVPEVCGCIDEDGDGYGEGPTCLGPDCLDEDGSVFPGAEEICGDGLDNDCADDGDAECECTEELDTDGDGFCAPQDCEPENAEVSPDAEEVCEDGIDNDCKDGDATCIVVDCLDEDGDGYGEGEACLGLDCNDQDPNIHPDVVEDPCGDGIDQNCDEIDPECPPTCVDADNDGHYAIAEDCPEGDDCSDMDGTIFPGAEEVCGDGIDNDCSEGDEECTTGVCTTDSDCASGMWCDTLNSGCVWPKFWEWWAPVVYVDTHQSQPGWDAFTTVDYDGNQVAGDNGDNVDNFDLTAWSYYSYVKTDTHVYLGYHYYFPRRYSNAVVFGTNYENSMQSVFMVIAIDSPEPGAFGGTDGYGTLVLMETTTEDSYYRYVPADSPLLESFGFIDGAVRFDDLGGHDRPIVYVDSADHDIYGDRDWDTNGFPDNNGVIYDWDFVPGVAPELIGETTYALTSLKDTLWPARTDLGDTKIFNEFSKFAGDDAGNKSLAPWGYRDLLFGANSPAGEILYDPATLIRRQYGTLSWGGPFSTQYSYNPYALKVTLLDLEIKASSGWFESTPDPYFNLFLRDGRGQEHKVLGYSGGLQNNWSQANAEVDELIFLSSAMERNWFYGLEYVGTQYFGIEVRDHDPTWVDGWLMEPGERAFYSFSGLAFIDWVKSNSFIQLEIPSP